MNLQEFREELMAQGVTEEQLEAARAATREKIDAYEIAQERRRRKIPQRAVAALMGVGQSRVSEIENGDLSNVQVGTLRRYAESVGAKLNVSFEWPDKSIGIM